MQEGKSSAAAELKDKDDKDDKEEKDEKDEKETGEDKGETEEKDQKEEQAMHESEGEEEDNADTLNPESAEVLFSNHKAEAGPDGRGISEVELRVGSMRLVSEIKKSERGGACKGFHQAYWLPDQRGRNSRQAKDDKESRQDSKAGHEQVAISL